jgi:hypothetical protein
MLSTAAIVRMPVKVKKAARIAAEGSVALNTENMKQAMSSSHQGLTTALSTRRSTKASSANKARPPSEE